MTRFSRPAIKLHRCARLLPLMIGELVPAQDPNFVLMLTITGYLFAPVTSEEIVPYLKPLIKEHHEAFCEPILALQSFPKCIM